MSSYVLSYIRSYLDKTVSLQLNKGRKVSGVLRGYDQFMNVVLDEAVEEVTNKKSNDIGMVVRVVFYRNYPVNK
jgi:small nuclear ribonucleoprotein G